MIESTFLTFLGGMYAGMMLALLTVILARHCAHKKLNKRMAWARGMMDALSKAGKNSRAAAQRGDVEAYEQYEAEFWAISAELDLHFGRNNSNTNDTDGK